MFFCVTTTKKPRFVSTLIYLHFTLTQPRAHPFSTPKTPKNTASSKHFSPSVIPPKSSTQVGTMESLQKTTSPRQLRFTKFQWTYWTSIMDSFGNKWNEKPRLFRMSPVFNKMTQFPNHLVWLQINPLANKPRLSFVTGLLISKWDPCALTNQGLLLLLLNYHLNKQIASALC